MNDTVSVRIPGTNLLLTAPKLAGVEAWLGQVAERLAPHVRQPFVTLGMGGSCLACDGTGRFMNHTCPVCQP